MVVLRFVPQPRSINPKAEIEPQISQIDTDDEEVMKDLFKTCLMNASI
jgi:hypothetical protein